MTSLKRHLHWIDGVSAEPAEGTYLPTMDPMTTEPWAEIARGSGSDVDRAVDGAHRAFATWRRTGPSRRAEVLWRLGDLIAEHASELAGLESRDAGKVIREVRDQQVLLRNWYHYYATLAHHGDGRHIPHDSESIMAVTVREPYGVIGVIPAFNSPMMLGAMGIAPALAAGNTVVVKPPEINALSLLLLGRLAQEAGLPDGCLNIVTGYGHEAGDALVGHPLVRKVFFTGGPDSARHVTARAAAGLKQTVLELGGKSANIVFPDVDVDKVVNGVIAGIFAAAGQTCVAGSRLLVHADIADELVKAVGERARTIKLGDPQLPETEMGPLSQEKIHIGVASRVEEAIEEGAVVVAGGPDAPRPDRGWFYPPTVLDGVTNDMSVARNELFGPVLSVLRFDSDDEAIAIANDSDFGLAAGVWTNDFARAHRAARRLEAGTVWVNTYRAMQFSIPFGGSKSSGFGRENGLDGFAEFTQPKSIWFESSTSGLADPFTFR
ncbi:aldehyde dehydrogenase [Actinomycetospora sp. NBRC 106375]|uniref:aldehyde dehydrogenase n=1 Tax=Actinomycetospora sp. NBRC 106375 TaxID=3032207 RepID=UPI0024A5987C|nr:aldehyde dehydrogenase [Actinomycetospora sp. NBRC 106375]GLZ49874.1 aldehyde dehydrogenase [Actinomycetospora sp. NBRC 106375]